MKKSEVGGPGPGQEAKRALRQKLNRPFEPPPSPNEFEIPAPAAKSIIGREDKPTAAELEPIARVIAGQLAQRPEHFITHPSEMRLFRSLSKEELSVFARQHGWRVVSRVGGRRIEFYNDTGVRPSPGER